MQTRIPQLDAIRGVAILMVIFHNQTPKYPSLHLEHIFANGWMGVDLFFVLSGFLITGILLDTKHSDGYFKNFYIRRCLRIWPLYYSVIFFIFVICLSPVLRLFLSFRNVDLYTNSFCRLDGLMAGALLALLVRSADFVPSRFVRRAGITFLIAAPLAFVTEALQ